MRRKISLLCAMIISILSIYSLANAARPSSYRLTYIYRDQSNQVTAVQKYYMLDNQKMRFESSDGINTLAITIYRKDKNMIYLLFPDKQQYTEMPFDQSLWDLGPTGTVKVVETTMKKSGIDMFKGCNCDVYEDNPGNASTSSWIAKDYDVVLKSLIYERGKIAQTMETTEFVIGRPDTDLFEIPSGYTKTSQ